MILNVLRSFVRGYVLAVDQYRRSGRFPDLNRKEGAILLLDLAVDLVPYPDGYVLGGGLGDYIVEKGMIQFGYDTFIYKVFQLDEIHDHVFAVGPPLEGYLNAVSVTVKGLAFTVIVVQTMGRIKSESFFQKHKADLLWMKDIARIIIYDVKGMRAVIGAIAGDIIGSAYENDPVKSVDFDLILPCSRYTDDTVLTIAIADSLLSGSSYEDRLRSYAAEYPDAGFSKATLSRLLSPIGGRTNSFGNGAAMRVSPIGWAFRDEGTIMREAAESALPTHGHPEGILWAQVVALGVFWARSGVGNTDIRKKVEEMTGSSLKRTIEEIRPGYRFDATAPGSVPESFIAFLEASSYEEAVRLAVSLGGDADTQACIAGALAEARFGGVPENIESRARERLPSQFLEVLDEFETRFH